MIGRLVSAMCKFFNACPASSSGHAHTYLRQNFLELYRSRLAALEEVRTLRERVNELGALYS